MSTELKTAASAGALAALGNLKSGLQNVQTSVRVAGGDPILRLGRDGKWVYGADNVEDDYAQSKNIWAINPLSIRFGYVCWKVIDPKKVPKETPELFDKKTYSIHQQRPDVSTLQAYDQNQQAVDHGHHPWAEFIGADFMCVDGEDKGATTTYEPSSTGGLRAMKEILTALDRQIDTDPAHPVPVVILKSTYYDHKTWGKTYVPDLEVVKWVALEDATDAGGETAEVKTEVEQPKQEVKEAVKQAEPETAPVAAAGGERRRRRAA